MAEAIMHLNLEEYQKSIANEAKLDAIREILQDITLSKESRIWQVCYLLGLDAWAIGFEDAAERR